MPRFFPGVDQYHRIHRDNDVRSSRQLYLYDSTGAQLASNDAVDLSAGNFNSRIEYTLPADGDYRIQVSALGVGGAYTLSVNTGK